MLPEDKRLQLDSIVKKMVANKESDANIQFVVNDFKQKYSGPAKDTRGFLEKASDAVRKSPLGFVAPLGDAIGTSIRGVGALATGNWDAAHQAAQENYQNIPKIIGSTVASAALPASLGVSAPASLPAAMGQYGALGALQAGGESLARGSNFPDVVKDTAIGGVIGTAAGGVFNLLGQGVSALARKAAPTTLSFTSGVPKQAIEASMASPKTAQEGLKHSVGEVRQKAVGSLQTLYNDLGKEFEAGLKEVVETTGQTKKGVAYNLGTNSFFKASREMRSRLTEYSRDFAREFRLGTKASPEGIMINFDRSPITSAAEQRAVQETFKTISTWDDFSAKGLQDLAERVGSLRKFESGAKTETSAIISKVYNKITGAGGQTDHGLISKYYPELATLRTNFAQNRKVLDEIGSVLSFDKKDPKAIQGAVSRLDNIFKENRDTYINIIKQLGERSGVDFLSLLAGGEFQKILPGFIRGVGGAGVLAASASFINPYLILLAPLFSPRAVGSITRNAPAAARATSQLTRAATTGIISKTVPQQQQPTK